MAFDFLGTFSYAQVEKLFSYAQVSTAGASDRVRFAKIAIERLGWLEYTRDAEGVRTGYNIYPPNSQLASYVHTFEFQGGDVLDLELRSRGDWIFLTQGDFDLNADTPYIGGKPSEGNYLKRIGLLDDATPGTAVQKVKEWLIPRMKRLEDSEFRIKRTVDLTDSYIEEIILLVLRTTGAETLEDLKVSIEFFVSSPDYPSATE